MKKFELIEAIAEKTQINKKDAEKVIEAFEEITTRTIKAGGEVVLTGFGTFSARQRKGRIGVNPRNPSEKIDIPSVVVPKFKAGKALKDALKKKEEAPQENL
jgi:DNA-binding protein HU-beta